LDNHSSRNDALDFGAGGAAGDAGSEPPRPAAVDAGGTKLDEGAPKPPDAPNDEYDGDPQAGRAPGAVLPNAGFGGSMVFIRSNISVSTSTFGRPYLAADSCFKASASFSFGEPSGGNVAILNGCVGTPLTNVRVIVL
jgi:hypothetical protein